MAGRGRSRGRGGAKKSSPPLGDGAEAPADNADVPLEGSAGEEQGAVEGEMEGVEEQEDSFEGETEGLGTSQNEDEENLDLEQFTEMGHLQGTDTELSLEASGSQLEDIFAGEGDGDEELAGDGADDDGYPADQAGTDDEDENDDDVVNDMSWVEELWNLKKAEEAKAKSAQPSEEEQQIPDSEMKDDSEIQDDSEMKEQSEEAGNETGEVEKSCEDPEKITPEQDSKKTHPVYRFTVRHGFPDTPLLYMKRNTLIPPAYFGPAFEEGSFQCCVRISPVSYFDIARHEFSAILQKVGYFRLKLGRGSARSVELFCQRVVPLLPDLLFCTYTMNNVTIDMEKRKPTGWTKVTYHGRVMSVPTGFSPEVTTKLSFKMKNSHVRHTLKKIIPVNTRQTVKERSLFINNLPPSVDKGALRLLFPLASKFAVVKVSENLSSAVLTMNTCRMVHDHLISFTEVCANGQLLELGAVNKTQKALLAKLPDRRARKQNIESRETKGTSDVKKDDKTESRESKETPDAKKGEKSKADADAQKLSPEEQEKRDKEKEKKKSTKELKERDKSDKEHGERTQREKQRVQKGRLDRDKSIQQSQNDPKMRRDPAKKETPRVQRDARTGVERFQKRGRQPGHGQQRGADFHWRQQQQVEQWREVEMQREMEFYNEMEMQQEMEMQRAMEMRREIEMREMEMKQELKLQQERELLEMEQREWQARERQKREWEEREKQKKEQREWEERERQKREWEERERQKREWEERERQKKEQREWEEMERQKMEWEEKERQKREQREWEERERQKREQARQEQEKRQQQQQQQQQQLMKERERLHMMQVEATRKLQMVEEERRREREELQRREREMEMERQQLQEQVDEERWRLEREREEQERLSRKRGRYGEAMERGGVQEEFGGGTKKKGKGDQGPSSQWGQFEPPVAAAGSSSGEGSVKRKLELEVARQAEELKKSLALLDKIQKDPSRLSASLSEVRSGKDGNRGGSHSASFDRPQQSGYAQMYGQNQGSDVPFQEFGDPSHFRHLKGDGTKKTAGHQRGDSDGWYGEAQEQKWPQSSKAAWGTGTAAWAPKAAGSQAQREGGSYGQGDWQSGTYSQGDWQSGSYGQDDRLIGTFGECDRQSGAFGQVDRQSGSYGQGQKRGGGGYGLKRTNSFGQKSRGSGGHHGQGGGQGRAGYY